ncbi:hypothetical protein BpHYR1_051884 [Brachionus plicatilis]|uniref:Uncharacterized protein n=1 Tax=Brachionus plicatilis TaxID=10195 RepID=A0A3M7RLW6_BRAPC|nr:hypothetical protein BpHYR1_051884 [Brachionus plicatilis]
MPGQIILQNNTFYKLTTGRIFRSTLTLTYFVLDLNLDKPFLNTRYINNSTFNTLDPSLRSWTLKNNTVFLLKAQNIKKKVSISLLDFAKYVPADSPFNECWRCLIKEPSGMKY